MTIAGLRLCSVIYLLIPNLLFFLYWTNLTICILGNGLLLYQFYREMRERKSPTADLTRVKGILNVGIISFVLILLSGTGGFSYQTVDHWAHNTKFYALYSRDWPLIDKKSQSVISYYLGYYVVPSVIFKIVGGVSGKLMIAWAWAGLFLGLLWINTVLKGKTWLLLIVMCTGDLVHFFVSSLKMHSIDLYHYKDFRIGFWSAYESLFWAPNQVIPIMLLAGMLIYAIEHKTDIRKIIFPISLSFWLAVFPVFFLAIYVATLLLFENRKKPGVLVLSLTRSEVWMPVVASVPVLVLYMSKDAYPVSGWAWNYVTDFRNFLTEYVLNIGINLGLFFGIYFFFRKHTLHSLPAYPFILLGLLTFVFSLYRGGEMNDFFFRGTIPYLIIFGTYMVYPLSQMTWGSLTSLTKGHKISTGIALGLLCATLLLGVSRTARAIINNRVTASAAISSFSPIPFDKYSNIGEVLVDYWSEESAQQYLGKKGSLYEKYIGPKHLRDE